MGGSICREFYIVCASAVKYSKLFCQVDVFRSYSDSACIAQEFASANNPTKNALAPSCTATTADA